ncbi:DUF2784 domain-containing protein [Pseudodesulfovibrio senegalensis]|jgi:hypothetical protein|uniref:DUF2784 domain-containing protein n=1 Tax=Pseudodesulfovibrio senegalensis TaxID=1721087 RepID=A0A6N6N1W1_9BACT|nr:DUF2784 domain-containing protein [Pseudodesulfovibrio senegalensis]KAB1441638.1 DUF2784 domain-containing protein [Pseudodesulfovibrio senegalensis]
MVDAATWSIRADVLLAFHVLLAAFNALSLPLIWLGAWRGWRFVRNPWFRWLHVALMGFVLAETLLGLTCPLTLWEAQLRGSQPMPQRGMISRLMESIVFCSCPAWSFMVAYGLFFGLILFTLWRIPPRTRRRP